MGALLSTVSITFPITVSILLSCCSGIIVFLLPVDDTMGIKKDEAGRTGRSLPPDWLIYAKDFFPVSFSSW